MIHSHFSSSFNQIIDNQNSNKLIKLKTNAKKRKKDNVTPQIYVENSEEIKKLWAYYQSKNSSMKNKN